MVDWDKELVDLMRNEVFCQEAFENPSLEIVHEDIMKYLSGSSELYDSIIIDLLDPSEEEIEWLSAACVLAATRLQIGGTLVLNAGGNYEIMLRLMELIGDSSLCKREYTEMFVPSFQEIWYLIRICKV